MSITDSEATELYREKYSITVNVRQLDDGAFTSDVILRKANPALTGMPTEQEFKTCGKHPTEDAAREAGFRLGKKEIDGGWGTGHRGLG